MVLRKASVRNKTPKEKSAVGAKTKTAVGVAALLYIEAEAPYLGKKIIEDPDTEHGYTAIDSTYIHYIIRQLISIYSILVYLFVERSYRYSAILVF